MDRFHPEELLFEIPIYRLSYDDYHDQLRAKIRAGFEDYMANRPPWDQQPEEEARQRIEHQQWRRWARPYWYNELIGVIRLYQDGWSIKGEYWGQPHARFRRLFRQYRWEHHGRVVELHGPWPTTSREVYEELLGYLEELDSPGGEFAHRHVDLFAFKRVGPHVDWRAVLSS